MVILEFAETYPHLSLILVSFLVTLAMTLITKYTTNQERMKELKRLTKECNLRAKEARKNKDMKKMEEANRESMQYLPEMMMHSYRPIIFTFIPLAILFFQIRSFYSVLVPGWIWWYIGTSIVSSISLRKILNVS